MVLVLHAQWHKQLFLSEFDPVSRPIVAELDKITKTQIWQNRRKLIRYFKSACCMSDYAQSKKSHF